MHISDVAREVTSWLDDQVIEKLFVVGLLHSSDSFWKSSIYWHSRVETLARLRVPFATEVNWAETHQILEDASRWTIQKLTSSGARRTM